MSGLRSCGLVGESVPDDLFAILLSNELNASYAADGYARVKWRSIGVLLTTYVHTISVLLHASYLTIMR